MVSLSRATDFLVVLVATLISGVAGQEEIRVGVLPSFLEVIVAANASMKTDFFMNITEIDNGPAKTSFDRTFKTFRSISEQNIHVIISPYDYVVAQVAETLNIPYISTTHVDQSMEYSLQILPETSLSSHAIMDVAKAYEWKKMGVFYDGNNGIKVLEQLMTDHALTVRAWRLSEKEERKRIRESLLEMRKVLVETCIVLCDKPNTDLVLDEARNLAMLSTPPYNWLFGDLGGVMKKSFEKYKDIAVNFTVVTLLPFNSSFNSSFTTNSHNKLHFALALDAFKLLSSTAYEIIYGPSGSVNISDNDFRIQLNKGMRNNIDLTGVTGNLAFDSKGRRDNFTFTLTTVTGEDNYLRGHWLSKTNSSESDAKPLHLYPPQHAANRTTPFPLKGRTVKVVMIQERPFTMFKRDYLLKRGNARFEGFAVDLIEAVADMLKFDYEIYLVHDRKFGSKEKNGEWNGLIGELLSGNATMSVASLVINSEREEVVDFTKPFKTRYISVVMKIPKQSTSKFEFLNPLSPQVWVCIICSFVVVSLVLYVLERVGYKTGTDEEPEITIRESFWFIFGSLLQGNTDSTPQTIPGRILTSAWWFFALILISSYTANLAAFLTVKKINTPIKTVADLTQQTKIKFGTVQDSGVMSFFKNTNIEHFSKMWVQMSEVDLNSMVKNTEDGYRKVKEEDYAFFWDTNVNKYHSMLDCDLMEIGPSFDPKGFGIGVPPGATYKNELSMAILRLSDLGRLHEIETKSVKEEPYAFFWDTTVNKYNTMMDCDLMEIGPVFDPKGFGIGVPPGATYKEELSMAILRLSDIGRLHEIEAKWWNSGSCNEQLSNSKSDEAAELQIDNVAGVFFILVGGIIVASLVCLGEYFANAMIGASKMATKKRRADKAKKDEGKPTDTAEPSERDNFIRA